MSLFFFFFLLSPFPLLPFLRVSLLVRRDPSLGLDLLSRGFLIYSLVADISLGQSDAQGHFNKPALRIDFPRGVVAEKWLERAKKRLEIDDQRALYVFPFK
jgi:hypothetical protein